MAEFLRVHRQIRKTDIRKYVKYMIQMLICRMDRCRRRIVTKNEKLQTLLLNAKCIT